MKTQYEKSSWGWNEKSKKDEMMEKAAWYLLLKNEEGKIYGFSHFRYDMDCNEEVLYVYEVCSLEKAAGNFYQIDFMELHAISVYKKQCKISNSVS